MGEVIKRIKDYIWKGVYFFPNGGRFEGEFLNGKLEGRGKYFERTPKNTAFFCKELNFGQVARKNSKGKSMKKNTTEKVRVLSSKQINKQERFMRKMENTILETLLVD